MSPLFSLVALTLTSLTVSATSSLRQDASLLFEQLKEATTINNKVKSDEVRQSIRMNEKISNFSLTVTNAAATQDVPSSYYVLASYADAACSTLVYGYLTPLGVCLSNSKAIYSYSDVDKSLSIASYEDSKCTGAPTKSTESSVYQQCISLSSGSFMKYSFIPSISAFNTGGYYLK